MKYFALCVLVFVCMAGVAFAADADAGVAEIKLMEMIFTGNIGLTIGLAIAVIGIINFVRGNTSGAIIMVLLGVIITLLPGIYNGLRILVCPVATSLGGHCGKN